MKILVCMSRQGGHRRRVQQGRLSDRLSPRRVQDGRYNGGNVLGGGFIGLGVDAMTEAIFKYPDTILIEMAPVVGMNTPTVTGKPVATEEIIS